MRRGRANEGRVAPIKEGRVPGRLGETIRGGAFGSELL